MRNAKPLAFRRYSGGGGRVQLKRPERFEKPVGYELPVGVSKQNSLDLLADRTRCRAIDQTGKKKPPVKVAFLSGRQSDWQHADAAFNSFEHDFLAF